MEGLLEQLLEHRDGRTTRFSSGVKQSPLLCEEEQELLLGDDDFYFSMGPYEFVDEYSPEQLPQLQQVHQVQPQSPKVYRRANNNRGGRKPADPDMEYHLALWIIRELETGTIPGPKDITEQARVLCKVGEFKFSKGWFCRFKARLLKQLS